MAQHTPPVYRGNFSFSDSSFFIETSGQHRHRRATPGELQAIFRPSGTNGGDKDPVGHWYEAQLLHYGLPPSKNKAVSKTRLLDAFNAGNLTVPREISKIEADLKKEWNKADRDRKATNKKGNENKPSTGQGAKKRKRDDEGDGGVHVTVHVNVGGNTTSSKIAKTSTPKSTPAKRGQSKATPATKSSSKTTTTPSRNATGPSAKKSTTKSPKAPSASAAQFTQPTSTPSKTTASRTKHTARRGGSSVMASRGGGSIGGRNSGSPQGHSYIKRENSDFDYGIYAKEEYSDEDVKDEPSPSPTPNSSNLPPLGLINGTYRINSPALDQWSQFDPEEFTLILCLEGQVLWGAYDFGMHTGILRIPQRPYRSSNTPVAFQWRGQEQSEGQISFGPSKEGWIRFLGDGEIDGMINCYGNARFEGVRISPPQQTWAERSSASMKQEWDGYNSERYEQENMDRWGRGYW